MEKSVVLNLLKGSVKGHATEIEIEKGRRRKDKIKKPSTLQDLNPRLLDHEDVLSTAAILLVPKTLNLLCEMCWKRRDCVGCT